MVESGALGDANHVGALLGGSVCVGSRMLGARTIGLGHGIDWSAWG
ncbi:hypothetical protein FHR67_001862 [Xanthomonas arboricola]|nr:hypothetical protein [Xanthomonas campestris]